MPNKKSSEKTLNCRKMPITKCLFEEWYPFDWVERSDSIIVISLKSRKCELTERFEGIEIEQDKCLNFNDNIQLSLTKTLEVIGMQGFSHAFVHNAYKKMTKGYCALVTRIWLPPQTPQGGCTTYEWRCSSLNMSLTHTKYEPKNSNLKTLV